MTLAGCLFSKRTSQLCLCSSSLSSPSSPFRLLQAAATLKQFAWLLQQKKVKVQRSNPAEVKSPPPQLPRGASLVQGLRIAGAELGGLQRLGQALRHPGGAVVELLQLEILDKSNPSRNPRKILKNKSQVPVESTGVACCGVCGFMYETQGKARLPFFNIYIYIYMHIYIYYYT